MAAPARIIHQIAGCDSDRATGVRPRATAQGTRELVDLHVGRSPCRSTRAASAQPMSRSFADGFCLEFAPLFSDDIFMDEEDIMMAVSRISKCSVITAVCLLMSGAACISSEDAV